MLATGVSSALSALCSSGEAAAEEEYPLDSISRTVPRHGPLKCPKVQLKIYRGEQLRYAQAARIFVGLQPRLEAMERVALAVGKRIYGRAPRRLVHLGTYNCRRIGGYPTWLSEHALGNAIDVAGFDFPPLARGAKLPAGVHRAFRAPFQVRVLRHWNKKTGPAALHARFLRAFAHAIIARKDIFRVLLGPGYPGHWNHFHFDMAPFRNVEGF